MTPDAPITKKETEEEKGLFSRFLKSESAAATAVIAILLLGLVFTIISVVKLEYVPEWKNNAEQDHIHDTWNDMVDVKSKIDILSGLMESGKYYATDFSATVPFNIGGGEVSVFDSSKSDGKLEVNKERCRMTIKPYSSTNLTVDTYALECDGVTYFSDNRQYLDQVFRYENGALILADGKSSMMKQFPAFTIEENKTNEISYKVAIHAVQLLGKPDSISSNTIAPLQLTGDRAKTIYNISNNDNIHINAFDLTVATKYPDAWFSYFKKIAQDEGLDESDYKVEYLPGNSSVHNSIRFSFLPKNNKKIESFYVSKSVIHAEITPHKYENIMELNKWYNFNAASVTGINLSQLEDYDYSKVNLSTQTPGKLSAYSPTANTYYSYNLNNQLNLKLWFNDFTEFEPYPPKSITLVMIYHLPNSNNSPEMTIAEKVLLPTLTGDNGNTWYLYNQTINDVSISDPSDLEFNLIVNKVNGNKDIKIDYLAVYLS
ncbi:MAG TPA: hypothetical protein VGK06_08655 [Methanosarcina sp.]|jgi:hypothetical protein